MKLPVFFGDFAVHRFVSAEFENTAFVWSEFDFSMAEGEACGQGEDGGG